MVSNHDRLEPAAGFGDHRHRDVDIVTFVVAGSLEHADSTGHRELLGAGDLQVLRTGSGVMHSERNGSDTEQVEYIQMWLASTSPEVSYERVAGGAVVPGGELAVVQLEPGGELQLPAGELRHVYLASGSVALDAGLVAVAGDALRLHDASVSLIAEAPSTLLAWTLRKR